MITRIGDSCFAIEYSLGPRSGNVSIDHWMEGNVRFVAGGLPLGDFETETSLNAAWAASKELVANRGRRFVNRLMTQSPIRAFHEIFSALSIDSGQSHEQVAADWDKYSPLFGLWRGLDVFNRWDAFLIEDGRSARFLWRSIESPTAVHEHGLVPGQFDDILEGFIDAMKAEYEARVEM